tara:strand:- start:1243 stop:2088 length:846 start_codon:yes stop_codon:yes gene_type:complete
MSNKICYYYQTFNGLDKLLDNPLNVDTIIVSSIHFGSNKDGSPYIHLNDLDPSDKTFDLVWEQTKTLAQTYNKEITVMLGGAGGAYNDLFNNYNIYYPMLVKTIKDRIWITGIDLDIEEYVKLEDVKKLINDIHRDFGDGFVITMAPLACSLSTDQGGMGGFVYKDLYNSPEGKFITRFNVQAYGSYSFTTFDAIVKNGYPPEKVVLGMLSGQFSSDNFKAALGELQLIKNKFTNIGGVFDWEYFDAPPNPKNPSEWGSLINDVIKSGPVNFFNYLKSFLI